MFRLDPSTGALIFPKPSVDAYVNAIDLRPNGEILVGGTFFGPRRYITEYNPTTFELNSFDPAANGGVYSMVLQPNGEVLVGGEFTSIGGQARNHIARLEPEPTGGNGSFVIGDLDAIIGQPVYFWGSEWVTQNHLSQGSVPSAFRGFANSIGGTVPNCGDHWRSDPGNSSGPPNTVPSFITVIASNSIGKSGPIISGNDRKIVVVRTDPGYGPSPSQAGTGIVTSIICE
jgi:hypothetical protein